MEIRPTSQQTRVHLDDLGVLEPFVRQALAALITRMEESLAQLPHPLSGATFSVRLEALHPGGYSALLYAKQTGRRESHILEFVVQPGGKAIASHRFWLQSDAPSCKKAADLFGEQAERGWQKWWSRKQPALP